MSQVTIPVCLIVLAGLAFVEPALGQTPAAPIPVGVVAAAMQAFSARMDFTGRIEAIEKVEIRARVTGFLDEVLFKDGSLVAADAPLYRMEQPPFVAAQQQARGALLQAQASYANASLQRARAEELVRTSAGSVATRDDRVAAEQSAQGAVIKADADLKTATIDLGYTQIVSPIAGRVGRTAVTKGNVASPSSGVLTTVLRVDPVYATFPVSQREFLKVQQSKEKLDAAQLLVKLRFADGSTYDKDGRIDFVDVQVDRATDTVLVRAIVPNPDGRLVDGEFIAVRVQGDQPQQKLVIPQAALITDQAGVYVFVAADGKAAVRRLKLGQEVGTGVAIEDGLKPGELVIVEGLQSLRAGAPVTATPVRAPVAGG